MMRTPATGGMHSGAGMASKEMSSIQRMFVVVARWRTIESNALSDVGPANLMPVGAARSGSWELADCERSASPVPEHDGEIDSIDSTVVVDVGHAAPTRSPVAQDDCKVKTVDIAAAIQITKHTRC